MRLQQGLLCTGMKFRRLTGESGVLGLGGEELGVCDEVYCVLTLESGGYWMRQGCGWLGKGK